jgi:hypothetical protein
MMCFEIVLSWAVFENESSSAVSRWGEAAKLVEVMPREHMIIVPTNDSFYYSLSVLHAEFTLYYCGRVGDRLKAKFFTFSVSRAGGSHWPT